MQDLAAAAVACSYYIRAAEQGHAAAVGGDYKSANELGLLYVEGKGLEEDLIEGFAWLYVGTHRSIQYEAALKNAMQLAVLLTREQLVVAQTRGQEYYTAYVAKRARR